MGIAVVKKLVYLYVPAFLFCMVVPCRAQSPLNVIAYYAGGASGTGTINPHKISHIIYSFCSLRENKLYAGDVATIRKLVDLKKQNPRLKVLLSLGGWGGCPSCSDLFSSSSNRESFARSVLEVCRRLGTDGLDIDWEYPVIEGFPGHKFSPSDRDSFTELVRQLRKTLGPAYEISFAAGGFSEYLEKSIDWVPVIKEVDRVNIMTYDLVNGYSTITGHHTALYSTPRLKESADNAVKYLLQHGVPPGKIVIGAAFYARVWQDVPNAENGLYQHGIFRNTVSYRSFLSSYTATNGYMYYWDDTAKAPFFYNPSRKLFVTFDNSRSVRLKTEYALKNGLNGIMFWQIAHDSRKESLLDAINDEISNYSSLFQR